MTTRTISEEDQKAKLNFITSFFDSMEKKATYLEELYKSRHRDEARILCSCYIDWLSTALLWPNNQTNYNFVRCLKRYSGKELFSHIHPKMMVQALEKLSARSNKWGSIHKKVSEGLKDFPVKLYEEQEFTDILLLLLQPSELQSLKRELWRGTFAAIVYERFRVVSVHGFGPPDNTTFDGTTFRGQPVPAIDFPMVYECLKRIIAEGRKVSQETCKWFGHDYE